MASSPSAAKYHQTLQFESLPSSTFLGLDLISLTVSPNFQGVRNVTPGVHLLYCALNSSLSIRHGQWLHIPGTPEASYLWRWDAESEDLNRVVSDSNNDLVRAYARLSTLPNTSFVEYLDPGKEGDQSEHFGEAAREWALLSRHVSAEVLNRVLGPEWRISSVSTGPQDIEAIPGLDWTEARDHAEELLGFSQVDLKKTWREGAMGRERTEAARDRSWYLSDLLDRAAGEEGTRNEGAAALLGELELCFLMVLTMANWSCLEQWKRILGVLLTCSKALGEVPGFFTEVFRVLGLQLKHCDDVEGGMFDFREEGAGWLKGLLNGFRDNVEENAGASDAGLKEELRKVENFLAENYGWSKRKDVLQRGFLELEDGEQVDMDLNGADEEDETGEYAPVIVDSGQMH